MADAVYEALVGAVFRESLERGRAKLPLLEALRVWAAAHGLSEGIYNLEAALKALAVLRILKKKHYFKAGYAAGRKDISLDLRDVLRELL